MNDYVEARVTLDPGTSRDVPPEVQTDVMAAALGAVGFESFVPDDAGLTAYAPVSAFDAEGTDTALRQAGYPFTLTHKVIEGRDWNQEWERNYFQPIVIDDQVVVHSSFHTDVPKYRYDITIDPKMAFGTGHHATTWLMVHQLLALGPLDGKSVLDMGTGTAILALVAAMRGAASVLGVEIDGFAAANARENVRLNGHEEVEVVQGDASDLECVEGVDVFLANINRNVILADLPRYAATLRPGATVLLSGFYEHDAPMVLEAARPLGLDLATDGKAVRDDWCCLKLDYRP